MGHDWVGRGSADKAAEVGVPNWSTAVCAAIKQRNVREGSTKVCNAPIHGIVRVNETTDVSREDLIAPYVRAHPEREVPERTSSSMKVSFHPC